MAAFVPKIRDVFFLIPLFIFSIISGVSSNPDLQLPMENRWESLHSLAFTICQNIVNKTDLRFFYTVDMHSDPSFQQLIHDMHETAIQTVSISHHSMMTHLMFTDHWKNIIFNFNDVDELLDFIFYTLSQSEYRELDRNMEMGFGPSTKGAIDQAIATLPRYCIKIDGLPYLWPREGCRKEISITSAELEHGSILSDSVFNATRGLYLNKIWNHRNHLIFLLKNVGQKIRQSPLKLPHADNRPNMEIGKHLTPIFCFKFFWRFFKGLKTVICHQGGCEKYDPFTEELIFYQNWREGGENFFDFSWTNMHKKPVTSYEDYSEIKGIESANRAVWSDWTGFYRSVLKHLENAVNCTLRLPKEFLEAHIEIDNALRYDISLQSFDTGIFLEGTDYTKLDLSVSIDTSALCIATPHSGYMSQGLVIFKSFSPVVWIFISITIAFLVIMQYFFQYSQYKLFNRFYTNTEVYHYRETSALLTVYAYFICGSPPSLHLGHLFTGKILFLILSFATIIISTVFLSGMTTLLSDRVLYPEIDTIRSLEESDMMIQIFEDQKIEKIFFDQLNQSATLQTKLVDNLYYYLEEVGLAVISRYFLLLRSHNITALPVADLFHHEAFIEDTKGAEENIRSIVETDAILVSVPFSSRPKKNIRIRHLESLNNQWSEYHLMSECLMTYPLVFAFSKYSFLFDKMNQLMAQYFETGHARGILEFSPDVEGKLELGVPYAEQSSEPRAFNLNDLQSGFIGLAIGLLISFLAFVGELLFDYFQCSAAGKFLKRFKNSFLKRGSYTE